MPLTLSVRSPCIPTRSCIRLQHMRPTAHMSMLSPFRATRRRFLAADLPLPQLVLPQLPLPQPLLAGLLLLLPR